MITTHPNGTASASCQNNHHTDNNNDNDHNNNDNPNWRMESAVVELTSASSLVEPNKTNIPGNDNNRIDDKNNNADHEKDDNNNNDEDEDGICPDDLHRNSLPDVRIGSIPPPPPPPRRLSAAKNVLYRFFYPKRRRRRQQQQRPMPRTDNPTNHHIRHNNCHNEEEEIFHSYMVEQQEQDQKFVHEFWTTFDDILMLSIFTQIGIVARLGASAWFGRFNDVFSSQSALFVNLPLNCLSCFCLGILCSGEQLWDIVVRNNPTTTTTTLPQQQQQQDDDFHPTNHHHKNNNNKKKKKIQHRSFHNDSTTVATTNWNNTGRDYYYPTQQQFDNKQGSTTTTATANPTRKGMVVHRIKASTTTSSSFLDDRRKDGLQVVEDEEEENDDDETATTTTRPPDSTHHPLNVVGGRMRHRRIHHQQQEQSTVAYHTTTTTMEDDDDDDTILGVRRLQQEMRMVQLLALERRIRASKSLLLFPVVKRKHVDVMVHYHHHHSSSSYSDRDLWDRKEEDFYYHNDLTLSSNIKQEQEEDDDEWWDHNKKNGNRLRSFRHETNDEETLGNLDQHHPDQSNTKDKNSPNSPLSTCTEESQEEEETTTTTIPPMAKTDVHDQQSQPAETNNIITDFTTNVQDNVVQFRRVNRNNLLLRGWVKGTTLEEMSDDLLLGLRDGFCGALSSFSSWNASMVNLIKQGDVTKALVGYMLGIQLPIIAYRFGQQVALYIFVWRTRREARRAERRGGYAIRLSIDEESDHHPKSKPKEIPSVRAVFFALFMLALIIQCTLIFFLRNPDDQQLALSLLFSPLGVFARWRLRRLNAWRPGFPLGTFISNMLACALAGSFGTLLAGNPGPRERIVLVSIIAGFGGTSSNLARFIVEILAGTDPILLRFDGVIYAAISIGAAMVIALASSSSVEWVDETVAAKAAAGDKEGFQINPSNNDTIPGDLLLF